MFRCKNLPRYMMCTGRRVNAIQRHVELQTIRQRLETVRTFSTSQYIFSDNQRNMSIFKSILPNVDIPEVTVQEYVLQNFDKHGDREAIIDAANGRSYTFQQLKNLAYLCASGLALEGFKQGDKFVVFLPNVPEYFIIFHAVQLVGGIITSVNPLYTTGELVAQLNLSQPRDILTLSNYADKVQEAAKQIQSIKNIYVVGGEAEGCKSFSTLLENDGSYVPNDVKIQPKTDVSAIPYSSGTTGLPKGVMLSHCNFVAAFEQLRMKETIPFSENDTVMAFLPFFHIYGMGFMNLVLLQGARLLITPAFEPESFLKNIQDHKVTYLPIVPPVALFLAKHPMVENYDLSSVHSISYGAAPVSADVPELIVKRIKPDICVKPLYGLTETFGTFIGHGNDMKRWPKGTCGQLLANTEGKIVDIETGDILPVGEKGNLCTRGPQTMLGYYKNDGATASAIDSEGWLSTGDICHFDENGFMFVEDRLKELIKYKGLQVAPAELEAVLIGHPEIQDAGVIGIEDEQAGEVPKAFVVTRSKQLTEEDVYKYVEGKVAPFKKLRGGIKFVDEIPKSQSGKILRRLLKDQK